MDNVTETISIPTETIEQAVKPKSKRGFASMDREKIAAIARLGGKAAHASGKAHQFSSEEAQAAGKKGGTAFHKRRGRAKAQTTPPSTDS